MKMDLTSASKILNYKKRLDAELKRKDEMNDEKVGQFFLLNPSPGLLPRRQMLAVLTYGRDGNSGIASMVAKEIFAHW